MSKASGRVGLLPVQRLRRWGGRGAAEVRRNSNFPFSIVHFPFRKYPAPGYRFYSSGGLTAVGLYGYSRSSTVNGTNAYYLQLSYTLIYPSNTGNRAYGSQVRCLRE